MNHRICWVLTVLAMVGISACTPAPAPPPSSGPDAVTPPAAVSRTLVMAITPEPPSLSLEIIASGNLVNPLRLFNASLSELDGQGTQQPYLAESLPQLNTDGWQVSPDGRMQTTYRLRSGLIWQ